MKIERSLILVGIFLVILCIVQAAPILPLVVRGSIKINEQDADIGTNIIAKIDNIEKGNAIVKDKGSYIIAVNGEMEDEGKTVEFYINGIKADQTAIFNSGGVIDLELSLNTDSQQGQPEPQPESYETNPEDNDEDDDKTSTPNKKRKREEQPEEIETPTENIEEKTITLAPGVEKESANKKIKEETPITNVISTNPSQPRLWQGITVMFILILIGLGIYFSIFKRAKFQQNGGERLK